MNSSEPSKRASVDFTKLKVGGVVGSTLPYSQDPISSNSEMGVPLGSAGSCQTAQSSRSVAYRPPASGEGRTAAASACRCWVTDDTAPLVRSMTVSPSSSAQVTSALGPAAE